MWTFGFGKKNLNQPKAVCLFKQVLWPGHIGLLVGFRVVWDTFPLVRLRDQIAAKVNQLKPSYTS